MPEVVVTVDLPHNSDQVWRELADISTHVEWMQDAVAIRFLSEQRSGEGTQFDCDTKIGPLTTTDRMTVTEWVEGERMSVRHSGVVTGTGSFVLSPSSQGTRLTWQETLHFPWHFGGPVGEAIAAPIFRFLWRRNLQRFAATMAGNA